MFAWFIELFTTIITWIFALFGLEYGKSSVDVAVNEPLMEVPPPAEPVIVEQTVEMA